MVRLWRRLVRTKLVRDERGAALVEFAITLPVLVVFVVGIYDFSGAFNQKQKIAQAAQEGAIIAGAQPMNDIEPLNPNANGPDSLQPVVTAVLNSLTGSKVIQTGACTAPGTASHSGTSLTWTFTIAGCSATYAGDNLVILINRGSSSIPSSVGGLAPVTTIVTVSYPYHWRFGSVIQLLFPGPNGYLTPAQVTETSTVHNQT